MEARSLRLKIAAGDPWPDTGVGFRAGPATMRDLHLGAYLSMRGDPLQGVLLPEEAHALCLRKRAPGQAYHHAANLPMRR